MLGDNIYAGKSPDDLRNKFELPYILLLDAGVKFYAALGNHDDTNEQFYKPFNMNGEQYYPFKKRNIRFFVLDSDYLDPRTTGPSGDGGCLGAESYDSERRSWFRHLQSRP